jgi:mycofactocin system glycosyltransferase
VTPLPVGFGLVLDRGVRRCRGGRVLVGGAPARALRLTSRGCAAIEELRSGDAASEAARTLGRRLVDAGMAHPRPGWADAMPGPPAPPDATVVVPVRDRAAALDRCLAALDEGVPVVVVDDGSADAAAVRAVCRRHGAALVRRESAGGPGAARNAALPAVASELVAFLDSDCIPEPGWLAVTAAHFADPVVGAVAPRVRPPAAVRDAPVRDRYAAARSPLDMGPHERRVVPGGPVAYVPAAAVVVRRRALAPGFDQGLRYGEDVDRVWRLHDAGWRVRLEPRATVRHAEPGSWPALLARRRRYGTAAAPLARRHPRRLAPLVARPGPAAATALLLARRPRPAALVAAVQTALVAGRLRRAGVPPGQAPALSARAVADTFVGIGRAATMLAAPVLLAALCSRRGRAPALALLAAPPLQEWARRRPPLDPLRWAAACIADDVSYGLGVWAGCIEHRTAAPLKPAWR